MAYGVKYKFRFESDNGVLYVVNLLEDGYSGGVTVRPLGRSPVISMKDNAPFRSTSCDLTLECQTEGEFAQLYTSNPQQFRVDVFRGGTMGIGGEIIWTGFVATEIYAEPEIAPPYDVDVTATDGLGVLKEYDFPERGCQTVREQLRYLLAQTGLGLAIKCVTSLQPNSGSPVDLFDNISIDLDYMVGKNCYEALSELLKTLHMTVTQSRGQWLLIRESDVSGKLNSSGGISVYDVPSRTGSSQPTSAATIADVKRTIGQMGSADMWPVGHMTRRVSPAKKTVTVEAPWHLANVLSNPDMSSDSVWETGGMTWDSAGYYKTTGSVPCYITQDVSATVTRGMRFLLKVRASMQGTPQTYNFVTFRFLEFQATGSSTIYYYDAQKKKWDTSQPDYYDHFDLGTINSDPTLAEEFSLEVPSLPINMTVGGTFHFSIWARNANVFYAAMEQVLNPGYRDNLMIGNGARGKEEPVVIAGGRTDPDIIPDGTFLRGVFVQSSNQYNIHYWWRDGRWSQKDFLSISALDYALSVALPRIELSGTLDVPSSLRHIPFVLGLRGTLFVLKSYDWDLKEDNLKFTALSLPAATLTIIGETISVIGNGTGGTSSGGSSSGGGGVSQEFDPVFMQSPAGGITANDITTWDGKYSKPSGGIPSSDMASAVQTSLGKADSAYQKPSGGIPKTDLASAVQTSLGKADSALQSVPSDYKKVVFCASEAAYNAISPKDPDTLYLIAETT